MRWKYFPAFGLALVAALAAAWFGFSGVSLATPTDTTKTYTHAYSYATTNEEGSYAYAYAYAYAYSEHVVSMPEYCAETAQWGNGARTTGFAPSLASVEAVRVGWHGCYERIVFDLNGAQAEDVDYDVQYGPIYAPGSGFPVEVDGEALRVTIGADARELGPPNRPMYTQVDFNQDSPISEIRFGGSFEGQSIYAIGVKDVKHFRVTVWDNHLIVDVATHI